MQADGTEKKMGAYLMKTCFQTTCISSAMFITAMAANPLAVDLAKDALGTTISWGQWALAGEQVPRCCWQQLTEGNTEITGQSVPDAPRQATIFHQENTGAIALSG